MIINLIISTFLLKQFQKKINMRWVLFDIIILEFRPPPPPSRPIECFHIGPADVQKRHSMDVQWTYQMRQNSYVQIELKWRSISDPQEAPCMVPGRPLDPHQTSTRRLIDPHEMSYLSGMVSVRPFKPQSDVIFDEHC